MVLLYFIMIIIVIINTATVILYLGTLYPL